MHYEIIDKQGQHTRCPDITNLQAILKVADTNTLISLGFHVISIIKTKTKIETKTEKEKEIETEIEIETECANNNVNVDDWYFKPINESWYPESERKLAELSSEYRQLLLSNITNHTPGNIPNHVWVLRHYNSEKMQELAYKLHISKEIDINEYRKQFEAISIEKVINHQDLMALLTDSYNNIPL